MNSPFTPRWAVGLIAAAALVAAGCGATEEPHADAAEPAVAAPVAEPVVAEPEQTLSFTARDHVFEGPTTATAGLTELTLGNGGLEEHQLGLFRLDDGVEPGTVLAALGAAGNLEAGRPYGHWIAGPNGVASGDQVSVVTMLEPGRYIVGCLIPSPDGTPHVMKGMLSELTVSGTATPAVEPAALPRVTLHEYHIVLPDDFDGSGPIEVENVGNEIHEFAIARLDDGATTEDVLNYEASPRPRTEPAPYALVTGTTFIDPGVSGRLDLDLAPGSYLALCFIPAPTGEGHLTLGMVHPFTVP